MALEEKGQGQWAAYCMFKRLKKFYKDWERNGCPWLAAIWLAINLCLGHSEKLSCGWGRDRPLTESNSPTILLPSRSILGILSLIGRDSEGHWCPRSLKKWLRVSWSLADRAKLFPSLQAALTDILQSTLTGYCGEQSANEWTRAPFWVSHDCTVLIHVVAGDKGESQQILDDPNYTILSL